MSRPTILLAAPVLALAVLAGCGSDDDEETTSATASAEECQAENLETLEPGKLTIATDSPAFPPYFEDDDPTNGRGFESAVAYAIAEELGFSESDVEWVVEPFNSSYAPGPKDFDFDVNQISITPKRAERVDFSSPYYEAEQAVIAKANSPYADADSLADLADAKLGVQIGTTSLEAAESEIQPTSDPQVFDTSNDVVSAFENGQVEAIVVDVPTAFFLTATQLSDAVTVGQFPAPGGDQWGALLEKDSPLTECVSFAIDELGASGELDELEEKWMREATEAPVLS